MTTSQNPWCSEGVRRWCHHPQIRDSILQSRRPCRSPRCAGPAPGFGVSSLCRSQHDEIIATLYFCIFSNNVTLGTSAWFLLILVVVDNYGCTQSFAGGPRGVPPGLLQHRTISEGESVKFLSLSPLHFQAGDSTDGTRTPIPPSHQWIPLA